MQELVALAAAVLKGEPRSVYRRTKCSTDSYGFSLDGVDIVTECVAAAVLFLLLPADAQRQGKRAAVKALFLASSPRPHALSICLLRNVCFARLGTARPNAPHP